MSPAIRVESLSKVYRINHEVATRGGDYRMLRDDLVDLVRTPLRRLRSAFTRNGSDNGHASSAHSEDFRALNDVSFEVQTGEVVGIIGRNGAGKSTLLKILSRVTAPTAGRVTINGRVGSLLEVGTGFHPELTGRENIFMNGSVLGMTDREIRRKFDEIVDFSGIEKFLDTPVKRYSSGMQVRLAFAVAAQLEPEILIVDEVLAVGDMEFQKRCLRKMGETARAGRTILFVSHNMAAVQSLCSRAILMDGGQIALDADTALCVSQLRSRASSANSDGRQQLPLERADCTIDRFDITDSQGNETNSIEFLDPFILTFGVTLRTTEVGAHVRIIVWRRSDNVRVGSISTRELPGGPLFRGRTVFRFPIDPNPLHPGEYYISIAVRGLNAGVLEIEDFGSFTVTERILQGASQPYVAAHGVAHLCTQFEKSFEQLPDA